MTNEYEQMVNLLHGAESGHFDFHARRLVEMAGHIIMGYLLLTDAQREDSFIGSAELYIFQAQSWNAQRASFIRTFKPKFYKNV
jgi:hypothetical protein